jgi:phage baseplate assembly protein gpV
MNRFLNAIRRDAASMDQQGGQHRKGIISSFDPTNGVVKVLLQPEGIETGWIELGGMAAGGTGFVVGPNIGDQVLMAPTEDAAEELVIVARVFDAVSLPPSSAATGMPVQSGEVAAFGPNGSFIHLAGDTIFLNAGTISITGTVMVNGTIHATGDVTAGMISMEQHVHGGVQTGGGDTGMATG